MNGSTESTTDSSTVSGSGSTSHATGSSSAGGSPAASGGGAGGSLVASAGSGGDANLDMMDPTVVTPPSVCAVDEALQTDDGYSIPVIIRNDSSQTIYLGPPAYDCSGQPLFTVEDAAGDEVIPSGPCPLISCAGQATGAPWACPAVCWMEAAITLLPGESHQLTYAGLYTDTVPLTEGCLNELDLTEGNCTVKHEINAGTFTFKAEAAATLDCDPTLAACDFCGPSDTGGCSTPGATVPNPTLFAETTVDLGPANGLFDPTPAEPPPMMVPGEPPPVDPAPGAAPDPVAFTPIVISFTDPQ
jgi:hypothetical protein